MKIAAKILVLGTAIFLLWYSKKEYDAAIAELRFLHNVQDPTDEINGYHLDNYVEEFRWEYPLINDTITSILDEYHQTLRSFDKHRVSPKLSTEVDLSLLKKSFENNNKKLALRKETILVLEVYNQKLDQIESRRLLELVKPTIHIAKNHQKDSIKVILKLVQLFDSIHLNSNFNTFYYTVGNKKIFDYIPCISRKEIESLTVNEVLKDGSISIKKSIWY